MGINEFSNLHKLFNSLFNMFQKKETIIKTITTKDNIKIEMIIREKKWYSNN